MSAFSSTTVHPARQPPPPLSLTMLLLKDCLSVSQENRLRQFKGERSRLGEPDLFMLLLVELPRYNPPPTLNSDLNYVIASNTPNVFHAAFFSVL